MADAHQEGAPAVRRQASPGDDEHAEMVQALDRIEAALDEVAATIARMG